MPGEISSREAGNPQQETRKSDEMRGELEEKCPFFIEKPFGEWSFEEKKSFGDECCKISNNFWIKTPGWPKDDEEEWMGEDFDVPMKDAGGGEKPTSASAHSEKFLNESYRQFYENIKQALENRGVDIEGLIKKCGSLLGLRQKLDKHMKSLLKKGVEEPDDEFHKISDMTSEVVAGIDIDIMPAFFDLIDSGYTQYDLWK